LPQLSLLRHLGQDFPRIRAVVSLLFVQAGIVVTERPAS
jgi:hypothetical protein